MPRNTDRLEARPRVKITTLEELDGLLLDLCQIDAQVKALTAEAQAEMAALKERLAAQLKPLQDRRAELERVGVAFVEDNKALFVRGTKKSQKLTHGKAGFQKKQGVLQPAGASKEENARIARRALEILDEEYPEAVRIKREIDKTELKKLGEEVWEKIRFRLVGEKDAAYLEPDKKLVADLFAANEEAGK